MAPCACTIATYVCRSEGSWRMFLLLMDPLHGTPQTWRPEVWRPRGLICKVPGCHMLAGLLLALEQRRAVLNLLTADQGETVPGAAPLHWAGVNVPCRLLQHPVGENHASGRQVGSPWPWAALAALLGRCRASAERQHLCR